MDLDNAYNDHLIHLHSDTFSERNLQEAIGDRKIYGNGFDMLYQESIPHLCVIHGCVAVSLTYLNIMLVDFQGFMLCLTSRLLSLEVGNILYTTLHFP